METVTITLDDDIAERARDAAAREGKSLSGYVADVLGERLPGSASGDRQESSAFKRLMALPLWNLTDENGRLPSREEMYAERTEQLLRRHQYPAVPPGSTDGGET